MTQASRAFGFILSVILLAGCGSRPQPTNGTIGGAALKGVETSTLSADTKTLFPYPGPWKTVETKNPDGSVLEALQARGEVGRSGGTLTVSTFANPKSFNYWVPSDVESHGIGMMMWERLVQIDPWTGEYMPRMAKSVTISPDGKTYTIVLRKGLLWSDNKPITADDVVFTMDLLRTGYGDSSLKDVLSVYGKMPQYRKIDDLTVQMSTAVPFAPFLSGLSSVCIAPKHVLEKMLKRPQKEFSTFWDVTSDPSTLVASGPFIMKRYVPSQRIEMVRNPNYFMVDKAGHRLPYLDKFVEAIVPDQNTMLLKFYGEETDFLDIRSVRGSDVALMKQREKAGNFSMYNLGPDDGTTFIMFNMCRRKDPKNGKFYVDPVKQSWFNNQKFRQAVSHAIDRQRIVDNVYKGVGTPLFTSESTSSLYFDKALKSYPQDLALSKQLLQQGGFVLKPDEQLYDSAGHKVEFTLMTNAGNSARDGICVSIQNELKKLGMTVNYQPVDFNILIDKVETSLDWDCVVMGLTGDRTEPYSGANVWKSNGRMHLFDQRLPNDKGDVTVTDARDWEKRIDYLFDKGATTLGFDKRKPIFDEYQQITYDQQPFIYIVSALDITAMRITVGNYKPLPLGITYTPLGSLHNLEEIFMRGGPHAQAKTTR